MTPKSLPPSLRLSVVVRIPRSLWWAAALVQRRTGARSRYAALQEIAELVTNRERRFYQKKRDTK